MEFRSRRVWGALFLGILLALGNAACDGGDAATDQTSYQEEIGEEPADEMEEDDTYMSSEDHDATYPDDEPGGPADEDDVGYTSDPDDEATGDPGSDDSDGWE